MQNVKRQRYLLREYINSLDVEKHCSEIVDLLSYTEFPFLSHKALEFALFRTYGIESVSKLLDKNGNFEPEKVCKRYDDTEVIVREASERDLRYVSEEEQRKRADLAIQRMNFIHSQYVIANSDYIYVWCLFVVEAPKWIDRFEFRQTTALEKKAFYLHWIDIGQKMGIEDLPKSFEEAAEFIETYEQKHMRYAPSNERVGCHTVNLFLSVVPTDFLKKVGRYVVYAMLDERLAKSMGFPLWPRQVFGWAMDLLLTVRGQFIKYLMLPRTNPTHRLGPIDKTTGLRQLNFSPYGETYPKGYDLLGVGPRGCPYGKLSESGARR